MLGPKWKNVKFLTAWKAVFKLGKSLIAFKYPYSGYTLRSEIEAPLITREVLPETYFLLVIMAADAQARPFLQFQASC